MNAGTLDVSTIASATAFYPVAHAWIISNRANFLNDARPEPSETETFAHLFVAFLTTSYKLSDNSLVSDAPKKRVPEQYAHYFKPASLLQVRTPDKKAHVSAREMKDLYLVGLAIDLGVELPYAERERLMLAPVLGRAVSYAMYGRELLRRSKFASQGEGVLVLWREIAWTPGPNGILNKRFTLSADAILQAEAHIAAAITTTHS